MRFSGHLKVTSDPREIDFIRKSKSFLNGLVKECVDMRQAKLLIRRVELEKQTARSITQVETTAKDIV